jgi:hypothetical protein
MSKLIRRLEMEELDASLQEVLAPRVERLNYLGEFFKCMGHQPDALLGFIKFTESAKSELEKKLVELTALTVATIKKNHYERNQHERLSLKLGYGKEWISEVEALEPENASLLDEDQRFLQTFIIDTVMNEGRNVALDKVVNIIGEKDAVALIMVIGRYTTHAMIVNSLNLSPPVPSIFEDGFSVD